MEKMRKVSGILRPPEVRGANRLAVSRLLQQNGYLSRADVARESGLSEGAISRIVNGLLEDGLIREDGEENTTGGRPGRRLTLESRRVIFGAEIQNWETRCAVSNMHGRILSTRRFRTPPSLTDTLNEISEQFLAFRKEAGSDRLPGLGICLRGIVNRESGVLVLGSRPEWRNVPVRQLLENRLREPVLVENNVRAAALAEFTVGQASLASRRCFVFVGVDEGVGMAVVLDGKLYHGPHMAAGELGEMVIEANVNRHKASLTTEELVSNAAICSRYHQAAEGKKSSVAGDTTARVKRIIEAAKSGDKRARKTLLESARYLGIAVRNAIWIFDADTVVIDGAITGAWEQIKPAFEAELPNCEEVWGARSLLVRPSVLGGEAALIGAATLPLGGIFAQGPSQMLARTAI
jgi:predicted NBD/HSP70 family sugar kinase